MKTTSTSRNIFSLFVTLIMSLQFLSAQSISNYSFAATTATPASLSGATAPAITGTVDNGAFNNLPIGFDFWYMGVRYTTAFASTNGWFTLGANITSPGGTYDATNNLTSGGSNRPVLAPLWDDLSLPTAGSFTYNTTGTAPNRIFTIEWLNAKWNSGATTSNIHLQAKLYEGTGKVQFAYTTVGSTMPTAASASIGLSNTATGSGNFLSLNGTGANPGISSSTETSNLAVLPASGQVYTFTPPVPNAPTALNFSAVGAAGVTLNWTDNSTNERGFIIYKSTDNINFTFSSQVASGVTSSVQSGLTGSTTYYFKVYAVTEGGLSSVLSGMQATTCATPAAPTVTSPVNYCLNATAIPLTASGSNLSWGSPVPGMVGGNATLTVGAFVDGSWNNKKTNFTTSAGNVVIQTVDYYIPAYQAVNDVKLAIFNGAGTAIAFSSTTTTQSANATAIKITNTFNYTLVAAGNYSIGLSTGTGNIGSDNPAFPITEPTGTVTITGVSTSGSRCYNNIKFIGGSSSIAPTPVTSQAGTTNYQVTQTVNGCTSAPATIAVNVNSINISQTPTAGLIANYKMEGNATDATGVNPGTLQNAPGATTDRFNVANKALSFNGTSQFITTANSYVNPQDFTVSIWFKTTTTSGGRLIGFGTSQTESSGQFDRHLYMTNSGQIYFGVYNGNVFTINTTTTYNDGNWHQATASLSASTGISLYMDGTLAGSNPSVTAAENYTGYWKIGFDNNNGWTSQPNSFYFSGSLDDALIYNRALSSTEIRTNYTSPDGAGNNGPACVGSSLSLNVTTVPGASYTWSGPNGFSSAQQNPAITYGSVNAGMYSVVVAANGCSATAYTTVTSGVAGQWTGNVSTDWGNANNWCSGTLPVSTTNVLIPSNATRMPLIAAGASANNITVQPGASLTTALSGTLNIYGTLTNSGTMTNSGTTSFSGTSGQQTYSGVSAFYNLTLNNPGGLLISGTTTITNNVTLTSGILNSNDFSLNVGGNWINNSGTGAYASSTGNVNMNGTTAQNITGSFNTTFNNLTINNPAAVTLAVNVTIGGNLSVNNGTFDIATFTANRSSNGGILTVANNAILKIGGTNVFPVNYATVTLIVASTVEYAGTNQAVSSQTYGTLKLSSSAGAAVKTFPAGTLSVVGNLVSVQGAGTSVTYTAAGVINVSGSVSIGSGTTFNSGNFAHNIWGNWMNAGTFNGNTGTIIFAGAGTNVSGTGTQSFNNVTVSGALVTFSSGTITVSGNLATAGSGSFTQDAGGTLVMTGASKTITGSGIVLHDLTIPGSVTAAISLKLSGNLLVNGSFTATAGNFIMNGTAKTISGSGTILFGVLNIGGTITTNANFTIGTGLAVYGTFSASAGTATFTGTSSLSGVANLFNAAINGTSLQLAVNSVLGLANTLTITTGTLNVTSSAPNTVDFNGTVAQNINPIAYNNISFSNTGIKTATAALTVNNALTINAGATFVPGAFTHTIYSDWYNYGTFNAGTSVIQFLGTETSVIEGSTSFNKLKLNKATEAATVLLQSDVTAAIVDMTKGTLLTQDKKLTITNTRINNGIILGTIVRTHSFTTGVDYAFEGADNTINFAAVSGVSSITVYVAKGSVIDFPFGGSISRVYNVSLTGTYNATLRLHYEDNELNGSNESSMGLWRFTGSAWSSAGKTANNTTTNFVELSGLTNMANRWTASDNVNVVQWNGSISSDWSTPGNWTVLQGSGSKPPSATDVANIGTVSFVNHPVISTNVAVKNIKFGSAKAVKLSMASGGSLTTSDIIGEWTSSLTHAIAVGHQTVTVNGNLNLSDGTNGHIIDLSIGNGTLNIGGSLIQSAGAAITVTGNGMLSIHDDYDHGYGNFTGGTGTVKYSGSGNQDVAKVNYYNLAIDKNAGIAIIDSDLTINGSLNVVAGQLNSDATLNVNGNVAIAASGKLVNNHQLHVKGDWINNGVYTSTGASIYFDGTGSQSISASTFNNFFVDKPSGTASLSGNVLLTGDLVGQAGTLDLKNFTFNRTTIGGSAAMADGSTLIIGANNPPGNFASYSMGATSTVIFNGTAPQTLTFPGLSFGHIVFTNTGVKTLTNFITVKGNLTIDAGATLNAGPTSITLNGNWVNNGTFVPASSTLICSGIDKTMKGSTNFNRMTVAGSYTFLNDMVLNRLLSITSTGSLSAGSDILITLKGDMINSGSLYNLGTTTFTGNVMQTLSLINAVQTIAITVNFNGSVSPVLNSTSVPQFGYLNINNTGGVNASVGWNIMYLLNVSAGATFNAGSSSHNLYGTLTNDGTITSSGTFNFLPATAKTLNFGTGFSSTGRVVFGGAGAISMTGTPAALYSVAINNSNAAGVTPSSNWEIGNNFSVSAGSIFNAGARTYSVAGNINSVGTINAGTSQFIMSGTDAQTITSATAFNNFRINKTAGTTTLLTNLSIGGNLNFVSGQIETGSNKVVLNGGATLTGALQSTGWVNGNLQKDIAAGSPAARYEVGDAAVFAPVDLAFKQVLTAGNLVVSTTGTDHPEINTSQFNEQKSLNRYWTMTGNGLSFTTYDATWHYASSDLDAGVTDSLLYVGDYSGASWSLPETLSPANTRISAAELAKLGDFTAGEVCNRNTKIFYAHSPYCSSGGSAAITLTGTTGGVFTSTAGISLNAVTGMVDLGASIPNTYNVVYTIAASGDCKTFITSTNITISEAPHAVITYAGPYCQTGTAVVNFSGTSGGAFSSDEGLAIDGVTGHVNLALSTSGAHTVTYMVNAALACTAYSTTTTIYITGKGSWTGMFNSDWSAPANWSCGVMPTATTDVTIEAGAPSYPVVSSDFAVHNIFIANGAKVTLAGGKLAISGKIMNAGIFDVAKGTIEMNGSIPQFIPANAFKNNTIQNLIVTNNLTLQGQDSLTGTLSFGKGSVDFNTQNFLTLRSTALATARVADITNNNSFSGNTITGNVSIERFIPARKAWRLLSAPVLANTTQTINQAWQEAVSVNTNNPVPHYGTHITGGTIVNGFDQGPTNYASIKVLNDLGNSFVGLPPVPGTNIPISNYKGYFLYIRGDRSFNMMNATSAISANTTLRVKTGISTNDQVVPVRSKNNTVFGNPYPSAIDFHTLLKNNVKDVFYIWDPKLSGSYGLGSYVTFLWNSHSQSYDATSAASPLSRYIPSGEAVLVEALDTTLPASITVRETDKSTDTNDQVFGFTNGLNQNVRVNLFAMNTDNSRSLLDGILTAYDEDYLNTLEADDAAKISGGNENIGIKRNGKLIAIERRKTITTSDTTFLTVYQMRSAKYQLEIETNNMGVTGTTAFVKDKFTGGGGNIRLDMNGKTIVPFTVTSDAASYAADRFSIIFNAATVLPVTITAIKATRQQNDVKVEWSVATEVNIKNYEVQSSVTGNNFMKETLVPSKAVNGGNANYDWLDKDPTAGIHYYRIMSIGLDESTQYSDIVKVLVDQPAVAPSVKVFPNPVTGEAIPLKLAGIQRGQYNIIIYNSAGQVMKKSLMDYDGISGSYLLKLDGVLAEGIYQLRVTGSGIQLTTQLIKE